MQTQKKMAGLLVPLVYAVLLAGMYYSTYAFLILHDWTREDYNYGYLIPFVVAYLVWEKRQHLTTIPSRPSWTGFCVVISALLLFWLGELGGELYSTYLSSWLMVVGLCWAHYGRRKVYEASFPAFIALTMFPLPYFLNNKIMLSLKLISSQLGVFLIQLYGMSAYRDGNIIDLGFTQLQVVDACSGLRYVMPLIILTLLFTYWLKASFWKKAVLVLSSIPLAIFSNSIRIALTGILYGLFGAEVAEGFFHGFSGWLIFIFTFPLLILEMWLLKKLPHKAIFRKDTKEYAVPLQTGADCEEETIRSYEAYAPPAGLKNPIFIVSAIVLGLTLALSFGIDFRQKIPMKKPFSVFPSIIGEWSGASETMQQEFINALKFSDYIIMNYRNRQDQAINFYVAYYENQQKGGSIHSPETCLPGSGWIFRDSGEVSIPLAGNKSIQINRAVMEKPGTRHLTYYWFPQRGRVLTNIYQLKVFAFWDALTKRRTDGALVRVITPVYSGEQIENADKRLQSFVRDMNPLLNDYIPGSPGH